MFPTRIDTQLADACLGNRYRFDSIFYRASAPSIGLRCKICRRNCFPRDSNSIPLGSSFWLSNGRSTTSNSSPLWSRWRSNREWLLFAAPQRSKQGSSTLIKVAGFSDVGWLDQSTGLADRPNPKLPIAPSETLSI